jgi:hypothetical protein
LYENTNKRRKKKNYLKKLEGNVKKINITSSGKILKKNKKSTAEGHNLDNFISKNKNNKISQNVFIF